MTSMNAAGGRGVFDVTGTASATVDPTGVGNADVWETARTANDGRTAAGRILGALRAFAQGVHAGHGIRHGVRHGVHDGGAPRPRTSHEVVWLADWSPDRRP
ncbi:hypothetical protein ACTWP5_03165 [Streptomyces sp. 4N509B]|uniref:hypothetical protein n=1 Tax=Streptomyces sp. 4N509B TaxID=3457413 RepID=UPI003FD10809